MSRITIQKHVDAPVDKVFDMFTDLSSWAERASGIERVELLTEGPVGVGTRFRETRIMFKRETTEELEFTAFEPGKRYAIGCSSCGCEYETTFDFTPAGDGTQVEMAVDCRPVTLLAKLMSPLGRLMAGSMKKLCERDLDDLKACAER